MSEIVVVSCTNRPDSNSLKVSKIYQNMLLAKGVNCILLDFCVLPENIAFGETFGRRSSQYDQLLDAYVRSKNKFIFVVPEYNGSFPGILKTFLDSAHPRDWNGKKACLVGIADGRAGNLRGMDHLTGILHYLKMNVYHDKLPISVVNKMMDEVGKEFINEGQIKASTNQIEGFLKF